MKVISVTDASSRNKTVHQTKTQSIQTEYANADHGLHCLHEETIVIWGDN